MTPLRAVLARPARAARLLVALDFDGTVAPLVDDPATARPTPRAREAVERLAALEDTSVAYVSGRPLADLARLTGAGEAVALIGSHGAETSFGGGDGGLDLGARERRRLADLHDVLAGLHERFPAARLEDKPAGMGVHTRGLPAALAQEIFAAARAATASAGTYAVREGKDILEFAVRDDTKGDAIRRLRARAAAAAVFFAGDDVTDEDGFRALTGPDDVGVKVGAGDTLAHFRVPGPDELAATLETLAGLRAAARE